MYSKGILKFTDASLSCKTKVTNLLFKPFINSSSFIAEEQALGFSFEAPQQRAFPPPGVPPNRQAQPAPATSAGPVTAFSGRGVVLGGTSVQVPVQQNIREVKPSAASKSKIVKEHEERTKKVIEDGKEQDLENQTRNSAKSKDEYDDLLNLS